MDNVKEAFQRVKEDINILYNEFDSLKLEIKETRNEMIKIYNILEQISKKMSEKHENTSQTTSTSEPLNQTTSTHSSTLQHTLGALKTQNMAISTGNRGVPTDKQTNRQTDNKQENNQKTDENTIENAAKILDSLDSIKKEIRLKFKRLTEQEILIFSTLYQVNNEIGPTDYRTLARKLSLSESSIRDYIGRLIKKGIPVDKKRINNKTIHLSVSENLRKVASLSTILQLRDL